MNDFRTQMPDFNVDPQKIVRYVLIGVVVLVGIVVFLMSWQDVEPGEEGFVYRPYGGGVDQTQTYNR